MVGVVRHRNHSYPLENWQRCFVFLKSNRSKSVPTRAMYAFSCSSFPVAGPEFSFSLYGMAYLGTPKKMWELPFVITGHPTALSCLTVESKTVVNPKT